MQNKLKKVSKANRKIKVLKFKKELGFETTAARSELMRKIRSAETKPEQLLRKELWKAGIRYRKNVKALPGSPDIVVRKKLLVVFVDGEFWHGYNWEAKKKKIKTNRKFWIPKIERNMQRDKENAKALKKLGFKVLRFWEHQIKKDLEKCINKINSALKRIDN
jgi:DNA mismatch endonuclease, patch repair protein